MPGRFDARAVWDRLLAADSGLSPLTLFMAVPTVYSRLIRAFDDEACADRRAAHHEPQARAGGRHRGPAALPAPVMARWEEVSGHVLLERYGMPISVMP